MGDVTSLRSRSTEALHAKAQALIPAGCHTYSRGDDQFPANAPRLLERAKGCRCWDPDGHEYLDWGMGMRAVSLGHAYPRVLEAVRDQLERGSNFTRATPVEVELAECLAELIPSAEMVKFAKNGSDVTSAAVRLARAYTERDLVARCRDNPYLSKHDWFIGSTPVNAGVPTAVQALTLLFDYNRLDTLEALFAQHPGQMACVIMEPASSTEGPQPGYLEAVQSLCRREGAVLIFDEIITGFRWNLRGAQHAFGVTPDLSTFGKAMANGFSVSALVGRREIMERGGLQHPHRRVFLLSSTHGAETHALAASVATIREMQERDVVGHIWRIGRMLQEGFNVLAEEFGIAAHLAMQGAPCSPSVITRDHTRQVSMEFRTLFLQEMIAAGILMPWIGISFSHGEAEVVQTLEAAKRMMGVYRRALEAKTARPFFEGPAVKPIFRPYN